MLRTFYNAPLLLLLISLSVVAQTSRPATDAITGRVVDESGQPLPQALVSVQPVEGKRRGVTTRTDREGTFKVTGLEPISYRVIADMPAYLQSSNDPQTPSKKYKVGDSATLVLIKGGVITGTVTAAATGEPVTGIVVHALIRSITDRRITSLGPPHESLTDDRGIYRIYGLPAGTYTVVAGGSNSYYYSTVFGAFDTFLPTYAPSSTRDDAAELSVRAGEETNNVDIQFRGERGRTISGTASGPGSEGGFRINLTTAAPAGSQSNVSRFIQPGISQFVFNGIADGDYYLTAEANSQNGERAFSEPKLIRVRGVDVEDVELTIRAQASVSGRVLLEESKANECQGKQPPAFKEIFISAWHKDSDKAKNQPQFVWSIGEPVSPDPQGNFTIRNLASSPYYFVARFPVRSWYLKSIAMSAARTRKPIDVTRVWTNIKTGDQLSGLTVTLAQGAASFQGQVEGEVSPNKLFVYLVPSEREAADELLRFYGGSVGEDGKIAFYNVAPGRYWILAQRASDSAQAPLTRMRLLDETETRAQLRRDAEAAKIEIELKPCQSLIDFRLPFKASLQ